MPILSIMSKKSLRLFCKNGSIGSWILSEIAATDWPSSEVDFNGASLGLVRAQYTYQLPILDLAQGRIKSKFTFARLSHDDCYSIAKDRFQGTNPILPSGGKDYAMAIEWSEAARDL